MHLNQAYKALGLPWAASKTDIRKAYRRLIKRWHPDRNQDPFAANISARINLAYEALVEHDFQPEEDTPVSASGKATTETSTDSRSRKGIRRSQPAFHNLFISIEQGATGGIFEFIAETEDLCQCCEGFTTVVTEFPCETCEGTGTQESETGHHHCPDCQGSGGMLMRCTVCRGSGLGETADFRFKAIIPKGVRTGDLFRFRAVGKISGDARFAAEAIVRVQVIEHPLYRFDTDGRLLVTVPRPLEAGERILVPTLVAGVRPLRVPSIEVQEALVQGYGYPEKDGSIGDLIVRFA